MKIAIFGTVGAGKTTLIAALKQMLPEQYEIFWEPIRENPYFEASYHPDLTISRAATYKNEIYMLTARYQQFQESFKYENVLYDRGIIDTLIFAHCNYEEKRMNEIDWQVYAEYFECCVIPSITASKNNSGYDLVVYLKVSNQTCLTRIRKRGIERELNVDPLFWEMLNAKYDYWYDRLRDKMSFFVVDGNSQDSIKIAQKVMSHLNKMSQ